MAQQISEEQKNRNAYDVGIHMRNQGWNFTAICALLGNMEAESGINPDREQDLYEPYSGGGPGFGLVQFDGSMYPIIGPKCSFGRDYMKNICKWVTGSTDGYNTVLKQCQIINYVMYNGQYIPTGEYPQTADEFKQWSGSLENAVYAFLRNFERAGIEHASTRVTAAQKWYNNLNLDGDAPDPTPSEPSGGQNEDVIEQVQGYWQTIVEKAKWTLDEGYYFMDGHTLRSTNSEFSMQRVGDTFLLFLNEEEKKQWVEQENNQNMTDNSITPSESRPEGGATGGEVLANSFIHELNQVVNHQPHVYYYQGRPQQNPLQCGWADCSGFIGWGLRNIHPAVWNNGYLHTGTIHQIFKANGYCIYGVGPTTSIPWNQLKPGDIINIGADPGLGAGNYSHVMALGHDGKLLDCNGSGGAQSRDGAQNIVTNYLASSHPYAAVYRIYK